MEITNEENSCNVIKSMFNKIKTDFVHINWQTVKQLAQDDPRRVVHSFKVGLAIALVSLFYYFDPFYEGFGVNAMWAVLTVVVVFEFSVGATLGKSMNRVLATIVGGVCAIGAHKLTTYPGEEYEAPLLGFTVFITAAVVTFLRFFPRIKARFDYGMVIFILTFSLICVSGYRDDEVIDMAQRRVSTILIGCSTAVVVSVLIGPVWAGTDLHKLTASNIEKLGHFFDEFGVEYFKHSANATSKNNDKPSLDGFINVINSKSSVDSLFNFASWEPRHGRFRHRHPWSHYQKVGDLTRHCACRAEALHGFLHSQIQAPKEVKAKFQEPCVQMSTESGKALKELSLAIRKMTQPSKAKVHIQNAKQAAQNLNVLLRSNIWGSLNLSDVTPAATVASLLADVVTCTEEISGAVQELASLAKFRMGVDAKISHEIKISKLANQGSTKQQSSTDVIIIDGPSPSSPIISVSDQDQPSLAMAQQNAE